MFARFTLYLYVTRVTKGPFFGEADEGGLGGTSRVEVCKVNLQEAGPDYFVSELGGTNDH